MLAQDPAGARAFRIPKLGLHKPTGQARVVVDGKSFYLASFLRHGQGGRSGGADRVAVLPQGRMVSPRTAVEKKGGMVPTPG